MPTRGERNNNPWNVKENRDAKGEASDPWMGSQGQDDGDHVIFEHPSYSARAAIRQLQQYYTRDKKKTFRDWIRTYAPPDDLNPDGTPKNNPDAYAEAVAKWAGFNPDEDPGVFDEKGGVINPERLKSILVGTYKYENGANLDPDHAAIDEGLAMFERDFGAPKAIQRPRKVTLTPVYKQKPVVPDEL